VCFKASSKVRDFLSQHPEVVPMVADWTGRQQLILDFLRAYGRESIPYYLVISGRQGKSIELPTIILPETIIRSLNAALAGSL